MALLRHSETALQHSPERLKQLETRNHTQLEKQTSVLQKSGRVITDHLLLAGEKKTDPHTQISTSCLTVTETYECKKRNETKLRAHKVWRSVYKSKVNSQPGERGTNMQYQWAEDDFDVPAGAGQLGLSEPVSGGRYIMYHGTTKRAAQSIMWAGFQRSTKGMLGPGIYLSRDLQKASRYPIGHPESDRAVLKVLVNVGRVIAIRYQGHPRQTTWHDYGYDTAWVPPNCGMVRSGLEEDCVWDPNRIQIIKIINPVAVQSSSGFGESLIAVLGLVVSFLIFRNLGGN